MWWQEAVVSNWGHSATLRLTPFTPSFFSFFFTSFPGYKLHNTTVDKHHFSSPFSLARDTNTPARREVPRVSPTPESPCSGTENQWETFSFPFHLPALKRCNTCQSHTSLSNLNASYVFIFFSCQLRETPCAEERAWLCCSCHLHRNIENIREGQAEQFQHHGQRRFYTLQARADSALAAGQLPPTPLCLQAGPGRRGGQLDRRSVISDLLCRPAPSPTPQRRSEPDDETKRRRIKD